MGDCKRYTNLEGAATAYRTRPVGECQSCVYFSAKNCGAHLSSPTYTTHQKPQDVIS